MVVVVVRYLHCLNAFVFDELVLNQLLLIGCLQVCFIGIDHKFKSIESEAIGIVLVQFWRYAQSFHFLHVFFDQFSLLTFVNVEYFDIIVQIDLCEKLGLLVSPFVVLLFELAIQGEFQLLRMESISQLLQLVLAEEILDVVQLLGTYVDVVLS